VRERETPKEKFHIFWRLRHHPKYLGPTLNDYSVTPLSEVRSLHVGEELKSMKVMQPLDHLTFILCFMKITTHRHVAIVTSEGKVGQKW